TCRLLSVLLSFCSYFSDYSLVLHSFPTRRSSDLALLALPTVLLAALGLLALLLPPALLLAVAALVLALTLLLPLALGAVLLAFRSEEHTSELQSRENLVCRLLLEKKKHRHHESVA